MKAIRSVIDDLVQRRLWPVALLLVVGIVAVPLLLGHEGGSAAADTTPAEVAAPGATTDVALATTDVGATDTPASGRALKRMHRRDPFAPPAEEVPKAAARPPQDTPASPGGGGGGASSGGGVSAGGGSSLPTGGGGVSSSVPSSSTATTTTTTTSTTTTTTTPAPVPTYAYTAVDVAFGRVSSGLTLRRDVARGSPLPGPAAPVVVFLGLQAHSHTAVFVVSGDADPRGDGRCRPRPGDCQTLLMRAGETEFLSVRPALYRLDLRAVRAARTTSRAKARAAARRVPAARAARDAGAARWVRAGDSAQVAPTRPAPADGS
jgi:hypothetical protein